jgi:hypothetical protein
MASEKNEMKKQKWRRLIGKNDVVFGRALYFSF